MRKYFPHIILSFFLSFLSQQLYGSVIADDTTKICSSKTVSPTELSSVVKTGNGQSTSDSVSVSVNKDSVILIKNAGEASIKTDAKKTSASYKGKKGAAKKNTKKILPDPTPEEIAIADFLKRLTEYTGDTLVSKKYAPPLDSVGNPIPYTSISDMLMQTPVDFNDSVETIPSPVFLSLIFEDFEQEEPISTGFTKKDSCLKIPEQKENLGFGGCSVKNFKLTNSEILFHNARIATINRYPNLVKYSKRDMPDIPVSNIVSRSMSKNRVSAVTPKEVPDGKGMNLASPPEPKLWKHNFSSSVQVSQAYISENWYQGGESNFNIISDQLFSTSFDNKRKLIFTASVQWKLGVNTSPSDTCHAYKVNEDLFQINSKFGIKAIKDWYYTISLVFKTQFFNSYPANSDDLTAALLSPGELNLGVGMSYNKNIEERKFETSIMLSPLSYNLKFSLDKEIAALSGILDGKLYQNQLGSSLEATFKWEFYPNLSWTARIFYFTNYKCAQSDIETGMDFAFNRYFSTKIYLHARYDDSIDKNKHDNHFQFKELLSFGFNYKFK